MGNSGADVNIRDKVAGQTPLHQVAANAHEHDMSCVQVALSGQGRTDHGSPGSSSSASIGASERSRCSNSSSQLSGSCSSDAAGPAAELRRNADRHLRVADWLLEAGASVDMVDADGRTALHEAVIRRHSSLMKCLIKVGAQIDLRDKNGATPLHWCAWNNDAPGIQVLLEAGAQLDVKDDDGKTPLHDAAWKGNVQAVRMLLDAGADFDERTRRGATAMHLASYRNHAAMDTLIARNACIEDEDKYGRTPLHWAAEVGHIEAIQKLLRRCCSTLGPM